VRPPEGWRALLERGADPKARASIRKAIKFIEDESMHEFRDVTPLDYERSFHHPTWANRKVLEIIVDAGGTN